MTPGRRRTRKLRIALVAGVVLGGVLASPSTAPGAAHAVAAPRHAACGPVDHEFTPARITIPGVITSTRVLALGLDPEGVPQTPPLTDTGKWQFAWDKASGIRPGGRYGVIRLTAHTYPSFAGLALGNRLLTRLGKGARLVVSGADGERLCYQVSRRAEVRAEQPLLDFYSSSGPSRLAILVCSGRRRGPGDWSHRTIWYATPTPTPSTTERS